jgi:hypothetical protein
MLFVPFFLARQKTGIYEQIFPSTSMPSPWKIFQNLIIILSILI